VMHEPYAELKLEHPRRPIKCVGIRFPSQPRRKISLRGL
jgi:hypothetical protein